MKFINLICLLFIIPSVFGQNTSLENLENKTDAFLTKHVIDGYVDYESISEEEGSMNEFVTLIENVKLSDFSDLEKQSFYINAYNLLVIEQIVRNYPTVSVKDIPGFFDRNKYIVAGKSLTLNNIEKDILLEEYKDSRFHFALVCGAKDCPKLWNKAFSSSSLSKQLDERTKKALDDPSFIKQTEKGVGLSEIFKWNRFEFGGKKEVVEFINTYRSEPIDTKSKTYYYTYDWTINDTKFKEGSAYDFANNSFRYVTSAAIPKRGIELKIFNNLYSQREINDITPNNRSTFFTTSISFLYGKTNRFNVGFVTRYRRVRNSFVPSAALDVFKSSNEINGREGFTAFGPQIRWAPVKKWTNFSIQSSLTIPIGSDLSGSNDSPFIDWAGPVFLTQFFNDKPLGDKFSLFTEIDLIIEEIGGSGKANRVSTPATVILSWFPFKNVTLYGLAGYSPFIVNPYDYFTQLGVGTKFQISPNFEFELLVTDFSNRYLNSVGGQAATYNIGFRYSR